MDSQEERILRAIMEGMTEGLPLKGKVKTWERMLLAAGARESFDEKADYYFAPLKEIEIDAEYYHGHVVEACRYVIARGPSLDYPELAKDKKLVEEGLQVESYLSTEELMLIGQAETIKHLRQMEKSEALRAKLARRVMIKLT